MSCKVMITAFVYTWLYEKYGCEFYCIRKNAKINKLSLSIRLTSHWFYDFFGFFYKFFIFATASMLIFLCVFIFLFILYIVRETKSLTVRIFCLFDIKIAFRGIPSFFLFNAWNEIRTRQKYWAKLSTKIVIGGMNGIVYCAPFRIRSLLNFRKCT